MSNDLQLEPQDSAFPNTRKRLLDLPIKYRWEVMRRNPDYVVYWEIARDHIAGPSGDPITDAAGVLALEMMTILGISGSPVDPATEFDRLDDKPVDPAFLSGALQPLTYRGIIANIMQTFSDKELSALGYLLIAARDADAVEDDDDERTLQRNPAFRDLQTFQSEKLDSYFDGPLVYIHLEASQRSIVEATEYFVRRWKTRRGISEKRVPLKKIEKYLEVWDFREGWDKGVYRMNTEQTLDDITLRLKRTRSTVTNQYRSAFKWVTGRDYTLEAWWRLVMMPKLAMAPTVPSSGISRRIARLEASQGPAPIPESRLSDPAESGRVGVVERQSAIADNVEFSDLMLDITSLFSRDFTDSQIIERLELPANSDFRMLRQRWAEDR